MTLSQARVTVDTAADLIVQADTDGISVNIKTAGGSADVFLGDADVTTSTGYPLNADRPMSWDLQPRETLYGVVASGSVVVYSIKNGT